MNKNFSLLIIALIEDTLLLLALSLFAFASLEVLLPELTLSRLPLALLFFIFFLLLTFYLSWAEKLKIVPRTLNVSKAVLLLLTILLTLALFISLRAFGFWASLIQVSLLASIFWVIMKK
jgi:hypothetical protein